MILKGFKFGMLLQIAVGPICIYIFNEAVMKGILNAMVGVFGVAIVDAIYISLSLIGITALVQKHEKILKYFGALVLCVFGIKTILGAFGESEISIVISSEVNYYKTFLSALALTASNPLTIVFWSGVFSTKIVEEKSCRTDEIKFGLGAVIATVFFLSFIAVVGQFTKSFFSVKFISGLNVLVGSLLLYFGVKLIMKVLKKNKRSSNIIG